MYLGEPTACKKTFIRGQGCSEEKINCGGINQTKILTPQRVHRVHELMSTYQALVSCMCERLDTPDFVLLLMVLDIWLILQVYWLFFNRDCWSFLKTMFLYTYFQKLEKHLKIDHFQCKNLFLFDRQWQLGCSPLPMQSPRRSLVVAIHKLAQKT